MSSVPRWIEALGQTADALFIVDPTRRVLVWNDSAERLLGYAAEEMRKRRCCDTLAGRNSDGRAWCHSNCQIQRAVSRGSTHKDIDLVVRARDGHDVCVNVSFISVRWRNRHLTVHLVRPVQSSERYKEVLAKIRKLLRDSGTLDGAGMSDGGDSGDDAGDGDGLSRLTAREIEILSLVARGFPNTVIASRLCVSSFTVRNHVQNILSKLGLHSKAQAVGFAYKVRLLR